MQIHHHSHPKVEHLLDRLMQDYSSPEQILREEGLIKQLSKCLMEKALQAELTHHLQNSTEGESPSSSKSGNSCNGYFAKTFNIGQGTFDLQIPHNRISKFKPIFVPKGQRSLADLDGTILALSAQENSTRDIHAQLEELYGIESPTLISQVTDAVSDEVHQWQTHLVDMLYPILFLDALYVKIRQAGRVKSRAVYVVLAILNGHKEVLGLWIGLQERERAKFWLKVLTELENLRLQDVLIACVDSLTGFPKALETLYSQTRVQLCIVHLIQKPIKYVSWKHHKKVAADLKPIYQAATIYKAEDALAYFADKYAQVYHSINQIWLQHWEQVIPLFDCPPHIRKAIYTSNAIESVNHSLRKVLKTKGAFPNETSVFKLLYVALNNISKKWTMPVRDWKVA